MTSTFGEAFIGASFNSTEMTEMNSNQLIMIRGLPGSGKSTMGAALQQHFPGSVHLEADDFFSFSTWNKPGMQIETEYIFDGSLLFLAHKATQARATLALDAGLKVIVSNTFSTRKEMQPYFNMADGNVSIIRMNASYGSVHEVPDEVIDKMRNRFIDLVAEMRIDG